ncbi:MSCS-like 2 [Hibiscus syriacus]|uniref:MSCS-like 2 n=1 Tax=Hibiscus syriacus TaxID=106335 RepID=A0A6A3B0A2_HIBSY|nr:MSCS-like 2 [Hibiscus syriacus]
MAMSMGKVYEELGEVKVENEKLRADLRSKAELCEHLKKIQSELSTKIQEASSKIEKQAEQLLEKGEISVVKQANEDLKRSLCDKESIVRHLNAANDKMRAERDEKNQKWEQENRGLVRALDEANEKNVDLEQIINVLRAENKAEAEEGRRKVEDQLKWKKEQFKHLEEAHDKLRDRFEISKNEWEQEKSTLLDDVSSLQKRLDSQIRVTADLENRLKMCNQALVHEETQIKYLEYEISEFKTRFGNIFSECQDAKSQLDRLNSQRENEVATLRHLLGTKESFYKETEYRAGKLEKENEELLASLEELQEARIHEARSSSSLLKLKKQAQKCGADAQGLESKDDYLKVLEMELEEYFSSAVQLKLQHEEVSVMLLLLKSGMSEARLKLSNVEAELCLHEKERVETLSILRQQLEMKNTALAKAQRDIAEERERTVVLSKGLKPLNNLRISISLYRKSSLDVKKCSRNHLDVTNSELAKERQKVASLLSRVESLDSIERQWLMTQKELGSYKERLEEASIYQSHLEEQTLQTESESREKLDQVCKALDKTKSELTEERERTASLIKRAESLDHIEEQWLQTCKELKRYKEASMSQHRLEEQAAVMENEFGEKLREICDALETANIELVEEHETTTSLMKRLESSEHLVVQCVLRQEELGRYKEMFEESSSCQLRLQEENNELKKNCNALEKVNSELMVKICERQEIEIELCIWKSIAEQLKVGLEGRQELCKELETSLLAQVEFGKTSKQEKDARIIQENEQRTVILQQQIVTLEKEFKTRELEAFAEESIRQITREHNKIIEDLQKEIGLLEEESFRQELEGVAFAHIGAERKFDHEKENLLQLVKDKDHRINGLMQVVRSMEEDFNSSLNSFSSQLAEKQTEINLVHEAWEKIVTDYILAMLEMEEKKLMIKEFEDDIHNTQEKLLLQEMSLSDSIKLALTIEAELEAKHLEIKNLTNQMEARLRTSEALVDNLMSEKTNLLEDIMKLSMDRESLFGFIEGLGDRISEFSREDAQLMGFLERIVQSFDNNKLFNSLRDNKNNLLHSSETKMEAKHLEMKNMTDHMKARLKASEASIDELKSEKTNLLEDIMKCQWIGNF